MKASHTGRVLRPSSLAQAHVPDGAERRWRTGKPRPSPVLRRRATTPCLGGMRTRRPTPSASAAPAQHNLKGVDVDIPRDQLTVCCGPSGSGKSSLAMDTIYAEGQRRYVESLSAYARQFVGQMQKPKVDHIEGLSPAMAIEQKHTGHTPRSTVGTVTEIYDYLRILDGPAGPALLPGLRRAHRHANRPTK